jgi:hypothetical protein
MAMECQINQGFLETVTISDQLVGNSDTLVTINDQLVTISPK